MTKRKDFTPEALRFARMALARYSEANPLAGPSAAFLCGFSMAIGYARLVGLPDATDQESISAEALRLAGREELEP
jgi:hypothetical protein